MSTETRAAPTTLVEVTALPGFEEIVAVRFLSGKEGQDSFQATFPNVPRNGFSKTWTVHGKLARRRVWKWVATLRPELQVAAKAFAEQTVAGYDYVSTRKNAGTFTSRVFPIEVREAYLTLPRLDHGGVVERIKAIGIWSDEFKRWEIPFGRAEALFAIRDEFEPELARVAEALKIAPSTTAVH